MITVHCDICSNEVSKKPSNIREHNFCSRRCYQEWRKTRVGSLNPNWKGGLITKQCTWCGAEFTVYPSTKDRMHCSLTCANREMAHAQIGVPNKKKGHVGIFNALYRKGYMERGELNKNYKGEDSLTKRNLLIRVSKGFQEWRERVFKRDNYTCQMCNKRGGDLHAHHIKPFAKYPELRFDVNNGQTLCVTCHRTTF